MLNSFKWVRARVSLRICAWIHAFLVLGLGWGHAITLYPPTNYQGVVDLDLVFRMGILTAIGSIITIVGLLMTRAISPRRQHKGLWVELVGTVLMAGGPFQFLSIQIGFLITDGMSLRYALVWFAYSMCALLSVRFVILIPALIESSRKARAQERRA